MKAAVIYEPGPAEVLKLEMIPIPKPKDDQVLIRIKAFGLNRSELFTRQGHSPGVKFPRVLGIEACGLVEEAPGGQFQHGQVVATAMGGMVTIPDSLVFHGDVLRNTDSRLQKGSRFRWRVCRVHLRPSGQRAGSINKIRM